MHNVIYFMDTDKDDIYSLIILVAQHYQKKINLLAIVCDDGFLSYPENLSLTAFILNLLEVDIPVFRGENRNSYLKQTRNFPPEFISSYLLMMKKNLNYQFKHVNKPWIDVLVKTLFQQENNSLEILVTGNLTSLSYLIRRYPLLKHKINKVIVMGGNVNVKGNVLPLDLKNSFIYPDAEYNFWLDPDAVSHVLELLRNKVELVPLDCTNYAPLNKNVISQIENQKHYSSDVYLNKIYQIFIKLLRTTLETENGNLYLWDLVATIIFLKYNIHQKLNYHPLKISMTGKIIPYYGDKYLYYDFIDFNLLKKTIIKTFFNTL